jgi:pSer/pThr/pTyr-binding forkhead associated (FHA) protein
MQDGRTRKMPAAETPRQPAEFLDRHRATLVVAEGPAAGSEFALEQPRTVVGRGPGVDLAFPDEAMSREHAAFEVAEDGMRVRDLGSTNGVRVNGAPALAAELKHTFRFLLEDSEPEPPSYLLSQE